MLTVITYLSFLVGAFAFTVGLNLVLRKVGLL